MDLDVFPATVKGPLATTASRYVTFARIFTHDGRLYVAEGRQRGGIVTSVHEYPVPEGEPERDPRRSKAGSWGEWSWSSCGCSSSWRKHSIESLVAQAEPLASDVGDPPTPDAAENPASPDASGSLHALGKAIPDDHYNVVDLPVANEG